MFWQDFIYLRGMKKLLLTILPIIFLLFSCGEIQKGSDEEVFYHKLDSLKSFYIGNEITITKRKFDEVSDPSGSLYLSTNVDRDNIGEKVLFSNDLKYKLGYGQILSHEYQNYSLDRNLMILVELDKEGMTNQQGWISLENIKEFQAIEPYLKSIK